ncbi:MAG TPA: O-antigen ligase family protein [Candidatus Moranbacteria bacterium]|nr:O-antigen ligase family protein [Candidatus Moranbacteria bacterium]
MLEYFQQFVNSLQGKTTKIYLILANIILVIFAIWFSNIGLLPFVNFSDFLIFAGLVLLLAIYRPGWAFVLFVGSLVLENVNLAPKILGFALRPYQFLALALVIALVVRGVSKRLPLPPKEFFPKFKWFDTLPIIFAASGFLSSLISHAGFKQAIVALSFVVLYFLARIYVQNMNDLKRILPFFLSSGIIVALYGILQNILFINGRNSFEVMPGRPNATFSEPDWMGIYLVFLLAVIYTIIYKISIAITNDQETNSKQIPIYNIQNTKLGYKFFDRLKFGDWILFVSCFLFLVISYITLILTVSRSAWLGAVFVTIGFLKIMLTNGSWKMSQWDWKKFVCSLGSIVAVVIISIGIVYVFNLSRFQIFNRAASTGGLQKITIACEENTYKKDLAPDKINNVSELEQYGCRHINLEEIEKEKAAGFAIKEIYRNDPNVNIRAEIYKKSWEQIKAHPIFGIGWGSISRILGTDERGAGLNASNIFLETWLGSGLIGILSFIILLVYIFAKSVKIFLSKSIIDKSVAVFILLGWTAIIIPNLFNSGIFLGFLWVYLAATLGLMEEV